MAVSPFTWIQSATLLGYQLSFVLGLAAAAAIVRAARARTASAAVVAGLLLGFAAFHRPFDALLAALPVLVYAAFELRGSGRLGRQAALGVAGALPAALLLAAFNTIVMGAPWKLPFGVSGPIDRFGFGWRASFVVPGTGREGQVHYTVGRALGGMWDSLSAFPRFVVATPVLLLLAVFVVVRQRRDPRVWLLVGMIATLIVGYLSWWGVVNAVEFDLTRSLGPFYHYLALGPLAVLAAWGLVQVRWTPATIAGLAVLAIVWTVPGDLDRVARCTRCRTSACRRGRAHGCAGAVGSCSRIRCSPAIRTCASRTTRRSRGRRVVGIDIPGRRLDAVERFPDRAAYLVRGFHRAGDILGPIQREQVPLEIVDGDRVQVTAALAPPADRAGDGVPADRRDDAHRADLGRDLGDHCRRAVGHRHRDRGRLPDVARRVRRVPLRGPPNERRRRARAWSRATAMSDTRFPMVGRPSHAKTCPAASTCRSSRDERTGRRPRRRR